MSGGLWAVLPVKPLTEGKSRLGLPPAERVACNRRFFVHVLGLLTRAARVDRVLVVSRDAAVLDLADKAGAAALLESPDGTLNAALAAGASHAAAQGARTVLSLAADLPALTLDDISALVLAGMPSGTVVIAPDRGGTGTNAMLMPAGAIAYAHGPGSFWKHLGAVREAGNPFAIVCRRGLADDVDVPADLARAVAHGVLRSLPEARGRRAG